MQQLVCAVGAETDLIMCAENRWPNLSLEMQLPMRDLGYPPVYSKSVRVINTALASTGKGVPRNRTNPIGSRHCGKPALKMTRGSNPRWGHRTPFP